MSTTARMMRRSAVLFCMVALASMAMKLGVANATARTPRSMIASPTTASSIAQPIDTIHVIPQATAAITATTLPASAEPSALQHIMRTAAASLQATYASINPNAPRFPDVVDPESGRWNTEEINANGAAGLLAGSLWSMYKLTGCNMWLARARAASIALRSAVGDATLGQAMGTLAYPALRYAYEAETDADEKVLYLEAALTAADSLARMYSRIPGVLKVQATSSIIFELEAVGIAHLEPMAVLSSVEGSAAATGLLTWASHLPGGKAAWRQMALINARHIVMDHMDGTGLMSGTLIYSALDPKLTPQPLTTGASSEEHEQIAAAIEDWLSAVGGQVSSQEMRQAMATMALAEALRAADTPSQVALFSGAIEAAASILVSLAADPMAMDVAAAATTACALAELSSLSELPLGQREEYAVASRHVIVTLARYSLHSLSGTAAQEDRSLGDVAAQWLSSLIPSNILAQEQQQQQVEEQQSTGALIPGISQARTWFLRGAAQEQAKTPSLAALASLFGGRSAASSSPLALSPAILANADGRGGSMLGDHSLLRALELLTVWSKEATAAAA